MLYTAKKGERLLQVLAKQNSSLDAFCGGRGTCGKCKIKLVSGTLSPVKQELEKLSKNEIEAGVRLACLHFSLKEDIQFTLVSENNNFKIEGNDVKTFVSNHEEGYAIAVDIGTTTVVMDLLDLKTGNVVEEQTFLNPQKIYGADVITRIDDANKMGVKTLQNILLQKMEEAIVSFQCKEIKRMSVCGNAVMTHLFLGADPSSIAIAPYTCKIKDYVEVDSTALFSNLYSFKVQVLPPISAYVGSDIVMDLYEQKFMDKKNTLLIDLGTNGEIALIKDGNIFVSSAACGPAFEGGNMQCGSGACEGAVDFVSYDTKWRYTTIHNKKANGVCGSGYMSWIAKALEYGYIEESGLMEEDIELEENIVLTQKDIREFQLAKSAIASACETLCIKAELLYKDVDCLIIAGGFGTHVNKFDLATLGIIPKTLLSKLKTIGNGAIRGTCEFAIKQDIETILKIIHSSKTIPLAMDPKFSELFMMNMMFEDIYES